MKTIPSANKHSIVLNFIGDLRPHEECDRSRLEILLSSIMNDGVLKKPIAVDEKTWVILDGHHRCMALKCLGCKYIPCVMFNYKSPLIFVKSFRDGKPIPKEQVLNAGLSGKLFPPRTTKHLVLTWRGLVHISQLEPEINVRVAMLK
ncbi:MAG: ParB N-terminal domain-containing protein [Thermofilum sp.]|jgi:hypothetical protein|nr:ParB N-terminal domain-containing protein [Thermofilum sp.]